MSGRRYVLDGDIMDGAAAAVTAHLDANPGPVEIGINSVGGIATEGAALMAAIERHGKVTVRIDGIAASAASLAAMGAARIVMHPSALMMIHEPATMTFGPADAHRESADVLDKMTGVYADAYARATGNPVQWVRDWMKAETWMTAAEALELNFCDEIEQEASGGALVAAFDYRRFKNAPRELVARAMQNGWAQDAPKEKEKSNA